MSKIFNWKGFIGESYDWNSSYINNCLEKAKKEYSELYLNINIASHDDTEEIEPFEFIGKKGNLWYLLGEDFTAFDHGYDTYEELSNVHGLGPFNKKKFYDLFKYNSLTEIYDKLSGIIPPKYTKQDIFDNFIEFIDEDIISPIADDSEVKSFEIKWIYHKIFYSRRAIKPHGTKPCYIVNLHMIMDTPSLVNNMGFATTEVIVDYDGDTRSATTPDIGADELNGIAGVLTTPLTPPVLWLKADAGVFSDAGVTTATNGQNK